MPTTLIDGTTTPYADEATAQAALDDQTGTGCYVEGRPQGSDTRTTFTSSFAGGVLDVQQDYTWTTDGNCDVAIRVYLTAADGLSVDFTFATTGGSGFSAGNIYLYEDDQTTLVDSNTGGGNRSGTFAPTISADGYYWIYALTSDLPFGSATSSIILSATGGSSLQPCTVRAAYDDGGGGTAYLICA